MGKFEMTLAESLYYFIVIGVPLISLVLMLFYHSRTISMAREIGEITASQRKALFLTAFIGMNFIFLPLSVMFLNIDEISVILSTRFAMLMLGFEIFISMVALYMTYINDGIISRNTDKEER